MGSSSAQLAAESTPRAKRMWAGRSSTGDSLPLCHDVKTEALWRRSGCASYDDERVCLSRAETQLAAHRSRSPDGADSTLGEDPAAGERILVSILALDQSHVHSGATGIESHHHVAA